MATCCVGWFMWGENAAWLCVYGLDFKTLVCILKCNAVLSNPCGEILFACCLQVGQRAGPATYEHSWNWWGSHCLAQTRFSIADARQYRGLNFKSVGWRTAELYPHPAALSAFRVFHQNIFFSFCLSIGSLTQHAHSLFNYTVLHNLTGTHMKPRSY